MLIAQLRTDSLTRDAHEIADDTKDMPLRIHNTEYPLNGFVELHGASFQTNTIRLICQLASTRVNLSPPPIQQVPILCSIKEVLRSKGDATVCFGIQSDLVMFSKKHRKW